MKIIGLVLVNQFSCLRQKSKHISIYLKASFFFSLIMLSFLSVSCNSKKKSIVIIYPQAPRSLDCHFRKELITLTILNNIYEPLVSFDENMKIIPTLADYWERIDSLMWIFYLRDGILFHNGKELNANDVIYSLYRPLRLPRSEFKELQGVLDTILSENPNKIVIKTKTPRTFLLYDLALIDIIPEGSNPATENPVGTGPYHFVEVEENGLTLEEFPGYWCKRPQIKRVYYRFVSNYQDRIRIFAEGKADIITHMPITTVDELEKIGRVVASAGIAARYLEFNLNKYPFNRREFRLAVNLGIDRESMAKDVYRGYAVPANQYIEPGVFGYDPTRKHFDYNPDSARKLIKQLGDLPVIELEYANVKYFIGEALAEELQNIGLKIDTDSLTPDDYWQRIENRLSNCYIISKIPNSYEGIGDITSNFHTFDPRRGLGLQNRVGYSNRQLDLLIESLPLLTNQEQVAKKMVEIQDILLNDLPMIPVVWEKNIYCVSDRISWVLRLDDFILVKDIIIKK